jgi:hypothetical protein
MLTFPAFLLQFMYQECHTVFFTWFWHTSFAEAISAAEGMGLYHWLWKLIGRGGGTWVTAFVIDFKLLSQHLLGKVGWTSVMIAGVFQIWNKCFKQSNPSFGFMDRPVLSWKRTMFWNVWNLWQSDIVTCQTDAALQRLYDICLLLYVQSWTPVDGRKDRPKHVQC